MQTLNHTCGIFFVFLCFILAVFPVEASADAVPPCRQCGREIKPGATYLKSEGRIFCSETCFEAFQETLWPKCSACGKKSPNGYTSDGRFYCSENCLRTISAKCASCGKGVLKGVEYNGLFVLCEVCDAFPKCHVCLMPRVPKGVILKDSLSLCARCYANGIFDNIRAAEIFSEVRTFMRKRMNFASDHVLEFNLCDAEQLRGYNPAFANELELGLYRYSGEYDSATGKVLSARFEVFVLHGLTRERFEAVVAHELAHDWMRKYAPHIKTPDLAEGFAEYISWKYASLKGYKDVMTRIEKNSNSVYGGGFRRLKKPLENLKKPSSYAAYFRSFSE